MNVFDYIALYSLGTIWIIIFANIILVLFGYIYYTKLHNEEIKEELEYYPFVSVMVPAHNEGIVIKKTVESLLEFDYPKDRYEIIVINDNSSDNSAELLKEIKEKVPNRNLIIINTDNITGGKGKSNALNFSANTFTVIVSPISITSVSRIPSSSSFSSFLFFLFFFLLLLSSFCRISSYSTTKLFESSELPSTHSGLVSINSLINCASSS